ncbi:MAG: hypothetical protein ACXWXT_01065 [Candidatus Binatia bacterium]
MVLEFEVQREFASFALAGGVIDFLIDTADDLAQEILFRLKNAFANMLPPPQDSLLNQSWRQSSSGGNLRQ